MGFPVYFVLFLKTNNERVDHHSSCIDKKQEEHKTHEDNAHLLTKLQGAA